MIPALNFVKEHTPKYITGEYSLDLAKVNKVIPLPVLFKNEQKYADVVDILDYYEEFVHDVYVKAGRETELKIHIGGDQLT